MSSIDDCPDFLGQYTERKKLSINIILKDLPTDIEINNGCLHEIMSNSDSEEAAARTIYNIAKHQAEFCTTNFESLRKKIQLTHNKMKLLKRKGNKTYVNNYAELPFCPPLNTISYLDEKEQTIIKNVKEKAVKVAIKKTMKKKFRGKC